MSFSSFFRGIGHGIKGAVKSVGHGLSSFAKPIMGLAGSLAPIAGTAIGGMYGGPAGAMMGSQLGGAISSFVNKPTASNARSQLGSLMQNYLPQDFQSQTLGQMGQNLSGVLNNYMPGFGDTYNSVMSMVPKSYLSGKMSDYIGKFRGNEGNVSPDKKFPPGFTGYGSEEEPEMPAPSAPHAPSDSFPPGFTGYGSNGYPEIPNQQPQQPAYSYPGQMSNGYGYPSAQAYNSYGYPQAPTSAYPGMYSGYSPAMPAGYGYPSMLYGGY